MNNKIRQYINMGPKAFINFLRPEYTIGYDGDTLRYYVSHYKKPNRRSWGFQNRPMLTADNAADYIEHLIDWRIRSTKWEK